MLSFAYVKKNEVTKNKTFRSFALLDVPKYSGKVQGEEGNVGHYKEGDDLGG